MDKNKILIVVFILLMASSGILLYRSFGSGPLKIPTGSGIEINSDEIIRNQIDQLDKDIKAGLKRVEAGGALDQLVSNPQYQELTDQSIIEVEIGAYGRDNPFLPVEY